MPPGLPWSQHMSALHPFLCLNRIPLCVWTWLFIRPSADGCWVASTSGYCAGSCRELCAGCVLRPSFPVSWVGARQLRWNSLSWHPQSRKWLAAWRSSPAAGLMGSSLRPGSRSRAWPMVIAESTSAAWLMDGPHSSRRRHPGVSDGAGRGARAVPQAEEGLPTRPRQAAR